jgi:DNA-formamidopyrimidine glycosylase
MPELPEVKIITEGLARLLINNTITAITFNQKSRYDKKKPDGYNAFTTSLPVKVTAVNSKGKFIWFTFENNWHLWQTLGLSGGWFHHRKGNTGLELTYIDRDTGKTETLYYDDQRRFGTLKFIPASESKFETNAKLNSLGPDVLASEREFNLEIFRSRLKKSTLANKLVGNVINDQKVISGLGNYLRAEILYMAKVSPFRQIHTLTDTDFTNIFNAIIKVTNASYKSGGASIQHYSDINDVKGTFAFSMEVYGKKHDSLGNVVKADKLDGDTQTIYWVPTVQV